MKLTTLFVALTFCAAGAVAGASLGQKLERDRIQATCEDDNAHTVINGVQYECMSPKLAKQMHDMIERLIAAVNARQEKGA
jgi:hypothetical protein